MSLACSELSRRDGGVTLGMGRSAIFGGAVLAVGEELAPVAVGWISGDPVRVTMTRDSHATRARTSASADHLTAVRLSPERPSRM